MPSRTVVAGLSRAAVVAAGEAVIPAREGVAVLVRDAAVAAARDAAVAAARDAVIGPVRDSAGRPLAACPAGVATEAAASTPPPMTMPAASAMIPAPRACNLIAIRSFFLVARITSALVPQELTMTDICGSGYALRS
jgi:hypothetical protein